MQYLNMRMAVMCVNRVLDRSIQNLRAGINMLQLMPIRTLHGGEYYYFALAFERKSTVGSMQPGIYWCYGIMYETTLYSYSPLILINGTTSGSTNATISLNKLSSDYTNFWIVYQQGSSSIYYVQLFCTQSGSGWIPSQPRSPGLMSAASGVKNYQPSIVQMPDSYDLRACWIRDWYGVGSMTPYYVNVVYWDIYSPSVYNCTGNMVNSVSLNIRDSSSNTYYAFAQNTNNSTWQKFWKQRLKHNITQYNRKKYTAQ